MTGAFDAILDVFTWIGLLGAVGFAVLALILWALDGTWLPAEALVDHDADGTWVRWYDGDDEANAVHADPHVAAHLAGLDRASIWYRHGWRHRMRLTRRPPLLRATIVLAWSLAGLAVLSFALSWVMIFTTR